MFAECRRPPPAWHRRCRCVITKGLHNFPFGRNPTTSGYQSGQRSEWAHPPHG
jgi:hypothetical protein